MLYTLSDVAQGEVKNLRGFLPSVVSHLLLKADAAPAEAKASTIDLPTAIGLVTTYSDLECEPQMTYLG